MTPHVHYADLAVYTAQGAFLAAFVAARLVSRQKSRSKPDDSPPQEKRTAKHSRLLMLVHGAAFAVLYSGIDAAIFWRGVPIWFVGQRLVGALIIGLGATVAAWAVLRLHSWRFRAALSEAHQLTTSGPYALLRHPIYVGLDLLALGSAVWIPSPVVWAGFVVMVVGGDLRGRAEEDLLADTYGTEYLAYRKKTWRLLPWIY